MADEVGDWLDGLGLRKYADAFAEQEITLEALWHLTEDDLKELGLPIGPRRIVLAEIAAKSEGQNDSQPEVKKPETSTREAERRQLTVMFCDMVGSTAMSQELDPEDLRDIMRRYHEAVAGSIARYGGYLAAHLGDGVLAYFGWPQANEDQAASAVWAGLDAVRAVETINLEGAFPLKARVGIATGLVVVGDLVGELVSDSDTVTGKTPNLAARLQSLAAPGEMVIDEDTLSLIGRVFDVEEHGCHELKGFDAPVPVWKVTGPATIENRFQAVRSENLVPFVNRSHELGFMRERWERGKNGEGQVIVLSGEAGIGKSRLVQAFSESIKLDPQYRLNFQCSRYHQSSAFYPAIQHVKRTAGFAPNENVNVRLNKLETLLRTFSEDDVSNFQLFASLLSLSFEHRYGKLNLSPRQVRERTIELLISQLFNLEADRPVLFLVEDAHWIDPTTEELISEAARAISDARVLMLVTCRSNYSPPWIQNGSLSKIEINRLASNHGEEIIKVMGGANLPLDTTREIVLRANGVPLFVEELTKALLESDSSGKVPRSLQALLVSRLDRLGRHKRVAQVASVLGKAFNKEFIQAVGEFGEAELSAALEAMLEAGLLIKTGSPKATRYRFKHSLIQDAAYQTLLKSSRRPYHRKVAELLVEGGGEREAPEPELVAWHFSQAGAPEEAVKYWLRAGQSAGQRFAHFEAIDNLREGLKDLFKLPENPNRHEMEFDIRVALSASLLSVNGWSAPDVVENYERAQELSILIGDVRKQFIALRGRANVFFLNGNVAGARELVDELAAIAEELEDTALLLDAYRSRGMCELFAGNFEAARDHLQKAEDIYDKDEHHALAFIYGTDPSVIALMGLSWAEWFLGNPEKARRYSDDAIGLATELKHPFSMAYAYSLTASVFQFCRQPETARENAEKAISIATENGFTYWVAWGKVVLGWAQSALGQLDQGIKCLQDGFETYEKTGASQITPYIRCLLAQMYGWSGDAVSGLKNVKLVIGTENTSDIRFYQSEAHRIAASLSEQQAEGTGREDFHQALSLARSQNARMFELRTQVDRLNREKSRKIADSIREELIALCETFGDDLEEPDLVDARAAIDR